MVMDEETAGTGLGSQVHWSLSDKTSCNMKYEATARPSNPARKRLVLLGAILLTVAPCAELPAQQNAPAAAGGSPSNSVVDSSLIRLPAGTYSNILVASPTNGLPPGASSNAIARPPLIMVPVGAYPYALAASPTNRLPVSASSNATVKAPPTGLSGGASTSALAGRPRPRLAPTLLPPG